MPFLTVITPTYNRASLLPRLYDSLCRQTCKDFEWIVVDDGSSDNSQVIIHNLKLSAPFPIKYVYKENGGKHSAVNLGVKEAGGELTLILDSDDELPEKAVEDIVAEWRKVKCEKEHGEDDIEKPLGGLCGYMAHRDGVVIGRPFVSTCCDELELRYRFRVKGDMCEVFRTDVLHEFPFPEIEGEKFCPEVLVWNRIACKYKLAVFPKVIYLRDYLVGGLSANIAKIRMRSPIASCLTYAEMLAYDIPLKAKAKAAVNYWRFKACADHDRAERIRKIPRQWLWAKPLGWLMHLKDIISLSFVARKRQNA